MSAPDPTAGERRGACTCWRLERDGSHSRGCPRALPATPDAGDVEALARLINPVAFEDWPLGNDNPDRDAMQSEARRQARWFAETDWLASREDAARREGGAKALTELAATCDETERMALTRDAAHFARVYAKRARDRAARIAREP